MLLQHYFQHILPRKKRTSQKPWLSDSGTRWTQAVCQTRLYTYDLPRTTYKPKWLVVANCMCGGAKTLMKQDAVVKEPYQEVIWHMRLLGSARQHMLEQEGEKTSRIYSIVLCSSHTCRCTSNDGPSSNILFLSRAFTIFAVGRSSVR